MGDARGVRARAAVLVVWVTTLVVACERGGIAPSAPDGEAAAWAGDARAALPAAALDGGGAAASEGSVGEHPALPPSAPAGDAAAPGEPDTSECEYLPALLAHGGQGPGDEGGFVVPQVDDHWECFSFAIPWTGPVQALAFIAELDDVRVVHHMILYALARPPEPGSHRACAGGPDRLVVGGWSPGQDRQELPPGYGALMPDSRSGSLELEIHYNNTGRHDARDRSGLKVCATSKLRPHTVATHMLGTNDIALAPGRQTVVARCAVSSDKGPATVLAASPHMHLSGIHARTVVAHPDGTEEVITDGPYAFADQALLWLPKPITVRSGDVLTTTCTYDNTTGKVIHYSQGSDGEMCAYGLLASPPGSITGGLFGGLLGALGVPNLCIGAGPEPVFGL